MDTITNDGSPISDGSTRGNYYPLDGRRETHPVWMAGNVKRLDPFQDAVPCWQRITDRPLADYGLTSYRYKGRFGWIMIGARDTARCPERSKTQHTGCGRGEVGSVEWIQLCSGRVRTAQSRATTHGGSQMAKTKPEYARPRFEMFVDMSNAAFEDNGELVRILRDVADRVDRLREFPFTLRDANGNTVGTADVIE